MSCYLIFSPVCSLLPRRTHLSPLQSPLYFATLAGIAKCLPIFTLWAQHFVANSFRMKISFELHSEGWQN